MQCMLVTLFRGVVRLFSLDFSNPTIPMFAEDIAGAPYVAKDMSLLHGSAAFSVHSSSPWNMSCPVVVSFSGTKSSNSSVTFKLTSTPLINTAHCVVSETSVLSSSAIENVSNSCDYWISSCFTLPASSVILFATVLVDKHMPSNRSFLSGHTISLALTRQSLTQKAFYKRLWWFINHFTY